ncbi:hypothetical protein TBLA_0H00930 [Henningerozyma blattae CBS 6284]|uniref:PRELI/MSF1 domain-containing protein n=1 Tax=Henningerozyma blattae (strain ATCC 34711 / CBS 6284 / DSM 70876 / NBRC 10599 / NRRL Y-10934 / UCD 77-7) TaxID=1071380 RepID=I2H7N0_HENB6|nr:hypothetical protein TBLA_0H00930 [Tetrapisispora blattae CBS 6284]CCH62382.1 hypothetical protein TBLA_0H00930 [Tetrapisispora blattae CBS 6284]
MKLFTNTCTFDYKWEDVTAANWKKYPNDVSTHVIAVDVLKRELVNNGTKLITERLITCQQNVPGWIMRLLNCKNISYVREVSTVDLVQRELTLRSCNLTYSDYMKVYEVVKYTPHPNHTNEITVFEQEAKITAFGRISKLCSKLEDWSVQRYNDNAKKGKIGFDSVLKIFKEQLEDSKRQVDGLVKVVDDLQYSDILSANSSVFKKEFENLKNSSNN